MGEWVSECVGDFSSSPWLLSSLSSLPTSPCSCLSFPPPSFFFVFTSAAPDAPVRGTGFTPGQSSPGASAVLHSAPDAPIRGVYLSYSLRCLGRSSPWHRVHPRMIQSGGLRRASFLPGCSNPGGLFVIFSLLPRTLQSVAPGSPPDDPVRGLAPCYIPPRLLQSGGSFCRILSAASDAPVCGSGFTSGRSSPGACAVLHSSPVSPIRGVFVCRTLSAASDAPVRGARFNPGRSSPGANVVLHSAPVAPIRGVFLSYSPRCLGRSSPWYRVHPRTTQSGGLRRASLLPGCFNPGGLLVIFSPLPRTLQSVAPGSPPDDPVRGLAPCFIPPRLLQSGGSFCHISSAASDAPARGTGFTPGRCSPGACAVLHSSLVAPIRGVFLSYSLCRLGRSSPWHRVHPRTIQSGGSGRAPTRPGRSNPGRHVSFSPC